MLLTERYTDKINGVLSCYDRTVIHGNIPDLCFDGAMTAYLYRTIARLSTILIRLLNSKIQTISR